MNPIDREQCPEEFLTPYKLGKPVLTGSGRPGTFDEKAVDVP